MKKLLLAAAILGITSQAFAADYYIVSPMAGKLKSTANINVTLGSYAVPEAMVGSPYSFDFGSLLQVTGDPTYSGTGVTWALDSGTLPAGLTLGANGVLSGTPTSAGTQSVTVKAIYRTKAGTQAYQLKVLNITVSLASASIADAELDASYYYDFKNLLSVSGDSDYSVSNVTWSATGLPAGLSLGVSTGVLSGTPTSISAGGQSFNVSANYRGKSASQSYTISPRNWKVSLLARGDGTNGSTSFVDEKGRTLAAGGDAYISTTSPKVGTGSIALDGVNDYVAITAQTNDYLFNGDFTIEAWVKLNRVAGAPQSIFGMFNSGSGQYFDFRWYDYRFQTTLNSSSGTDLGGTIALGTWTHVALVRNSGAIKLYVNGTQAGVTLNNASQLGFNAPAYLGANRPSENNLNGYLDEVRIVNGKAMYTSNFTPSNSPLAP